MVSRISKKQLKGIKGKVYSLYVRRIFAICSPYIRNMSAVCPPYLISFNLMLAKYSWYQKRSNNTQLAGIIETKFSITPDMGVNLKLGRGT